jgi:hypothetical protein
VREMKEITCPNCGKGFNIDDSGYLEILSQVRTDEFNRDLEARMNQALTERKTAIELAEAKKDAEIAKLSAELDKAKQIEDVNIALAISKVKDEFSVELAKKDEEIAFHKDYKAKLSTKMVGETLEQHCQIEFEKMRPIGFPRAYFAKDNDSKTGSKGDFIFKDFSEEGTEYISIMFEMKNESDETATKKKNEDFLKELDKDRREKGCEYAVLVSLLEADNELYNTGIVDVSHKYEKMYVIRPQFFIPLISLLRNAAGNSLKYKAELEKIKEQNIDITNFERDLDEFKTAFGRDYRLASDKFQNAIDEIDKTIASLEKTKKALQESDTYLSRANGKAEDLTVKRLTRRNVTMAAKFAELEGGSTQAELEG